MVMVFVATFQVLGLTLITEPLNNMMNGIFAFAPRLLGGGILVILALVLAMAVRMILGKVLAGAKLDERLGDGNGDSESPAPVSKSIADTAYWLVLLIMLPAILGAFGMEGLLAPVQGLIDKLLGFLPNLFAAAVVLLVGWFVARIVQRVLTGLLAAAGADRLGQRIGLDASEGGRGLAAMAGFVVYVMILIPVLIGALNALSLDAVTAPASAMLDTLLGALPNLFAAAIILVIATVIGRFVADLVATLLAGIGFDRLPARLGLVSADAAPATTLSRVARTVVLVAFVLFAAVEAADLLGFAALSALTAQFLVFAGQVLLGVVILGAGLFLANLVAGVVGGSSPTLARVARVAVVTLSAAMALNQMGFATEIINLAFGLMVGALAVAFAIAFGIGGRETAARQLDRWRQDGRGGSDSSGS
jgi:hypothetical protein